jgi:hypothetical protein
MDSDALEARRLRMLARLSRNDARRSVNPVTRALLLQKAEDYDRAAGELELRSLGEGGERQS